MRKRSGVLMSGPVLRGVVGRGGVAGGLQVDGELVASSSLPPRPRPRPRPAPRPAQRRLLAQPRLPAQDSGPAVSLLVLSTPTVRRMLSRKLQQLQLQRPARPRAIAS